MFVSLLLYSLTTFFKLHLHILFELCHLAHRIGLIIIILLPTYKLLLCYVEFDCIVCTCNCFHIVVYVLAPLYCVNVIKVYHTKEIEKDC